MAVVAVVGLGQVDANPHGDDMCMDVAGKIGGVTAGTLTTFPIGRTDTAAICCTVASNAAILGVDFTSAGKW